MIIEQTGSFLEEIQAVIVLYNCRLEDSTTFLSLNESILKVFGKETLSLLIYDNSLNAQDIKFNKYSRWSIEYKHNPSNSGVSSAYNLGADFAISHGKKWLILLDQDTFFPITSLDIYLQAIGESKNTGPSLFCPVLISNGLVISPCKVKNFHGSPLRLAPSPGTYYLKELCPVNSGLLIRVNTFLQVGGYNEAIKLDFSDFEFLHRYKSYFKEFVILPIQCRHGLSSHCDITKESAINRFGYYISGARQLRKTLLEYFKIEIFILLRSIKLSLKYKDVSFVQRWLRK